VLDEARNAATATLTRLVWDCSHFGLKVGRIAACLDDEELREALDTARCEQFRLLYWTTPAAREVPARLLADYNGMQVDRKVTFVRPLRGDNERAPIADRLHVGPYCKTEASLELIALSVAAGVFSRFGVDPRIPRDKFESLYRIWIERSVRHEIADAVLVARDETCVDALAGMITTTVADHVGNIGLIAVSEDYRGQGVGTQLIAAAHAWMHERGAERATVVTQLANLPACRLYERTGYEMDHIENYYHFWP